MNPINLPQLVTRKPTKATFAKKAIFKTNFANAKTLLCAMLSPALLLVGCQSVAPFSQNPNSVNPNSLNQIPLDNVQSKTQLVSAIKRAFLHNQDWVATQQFHSLSASDLPAVTPNATNVTRTTLDQCQTDHDRAYVAQLKLNGITSEEKVSQLLPEQHHVYDEIKDTYLSCQKMVKAIENARNATADARDVEVSSENISDNTPDLTGLDPKQAELMNNMVTNSASVQYTGIYRPLHRRIALQADVGFDNRNTHYHYRMPMVVDAKTEALYVKPDILMPYTSIYLDNQLGMSWQDKWYKFSNPSNDKLPRTMLIKAWLKALRTSVDSLPVSQFNSLTPAQVQTLAQQVSVTVPQNTQPLDLSRQPTVIEWKQTASEQQAFIQQVKTSFIENIDNAMTTDSQFLSLPADKQARLSEQWQTTRAKLDKSLNKSFTKGQDSQIESQHVDKNTNKKGFMQRQQGITLDFVLDNGTLKHIYHQQITNFGRKPFSLATWQTFSPDTRPLASAVLPSTLNQLSQSIQDTPQGNVLDGVQEFERIRKLDDSRRGFGQPATVFSQYNKYRKAAKAKALEENSATANEPNNKPN